jgi:hypothetical protein
MALQEIGTALLFYLPFLLTIVVAFFALTIGIVAIFSGTLLILFLAAYGFYSVLRDMGFLELCIKKFQSLWKHMSLDVEKNIQLSFLIKDLDKLPSTTALFLCHPHGLIGYSWMLHFCYGIHPWPVTKPKPVVAIHSIFFRIPIVRDVLEQFHCIEAREDIIRHHLEKGTSVAIATGGIEEMLYNGEKKVKLVLQKRKGYARIAKHCNVPIVPLFTVGENELFPSESFWVWKGIQTLVYRWTGIQVPLPTWTSMKSWASILRKPLETPVETFVLGVLKTQGKKEDKIRTDCVKMYEDFFECHSLQAKVVA